MAKDKNGPKPEKPKPIDVLHGRLNRRTVAASWRQGDSHRTLDERDNPLPSLPKSLDALKSVAAEVLHVPTAWTEQNFRVVGITFGDQGGAATFSLICRKSFEDASKEFAFATPPRLLAHPTEPGSYTPPVSPKAVDAVEDAREQFKAYIRNERAQGLIPLDDGDEEDDGTGTEPAEGAELPFPAGSAGKPARRSRSTSAKAAAGA